MKKKVKKLIVWLMHTLNVHNKNYPKVTFRLSVLGFIGSIGFYISVLQGLKGTDETDKTEQIKALEHEKKQLQNHIDLLIEKQ